MDALQVINGSYGEVWLDGDKLGETKGFQAKVEFIKEDVDIAGKMARYKKVVGWEGKGTLRLHKVNSRLALKMRQLYAEGKNVTFTLLGKLDDKDVIGAERVVIRDVMFDDLTLMDFEPKKLLEVECPFTFSDFEFIDTID